VVGTVDGSNLLEDYAVKGYTKILGIIVIILKLMDVQICSLFFLLKIIGTKNLEN